jgi:type III secretory pathway component EscT
LNEYACRHLVPALLPPAYQSSHSVDLTALGPVQVMLFQEIIVGAVLGLTARLPISALQITGAVLAQQTGLSHRHKASKGCWSAIFSRCSASCDGRCRSGDPARTL